MAVDLLAETLRAAIQTVEETVASGDLESMDYLAGQSVGLVRDIKPAAEIVQEIVEGARTILTNLASHSLA